MSGRDGQERPNSDASVSDGSRLGTKGPEAWVCSYGVLHKSESLPGLLPVELSVERKCSWQVCCWKAFSEWGNLDPQSLLQSESQSTTVILQ